LLRGAAEGHSIPYRAAVKAAFLNHSLFICRT
jgi:hypothetical protein